MSQAATMAWFARHELRLAWRDWLSMMTAGRPGRGRWVVAGIIAFGVFLHLLAFGILASHAVDVDDSKASMLVLTGSALLAWTLMLSQAMESVTRAFYARADLDLILSSPASSRAVFSLRIVSIALTTTLMSVLLVGPFVNVLAAFAGPRFLGAYGVMAAMGALATALAVGATVLLFRLIGPKRTRLVAQIIAAVVGAGFVIGVQAVAVVSWGNLSRIAVFQSKAWLDAAPGPDSLFWWPARAAMGDTGSLLVVVALGFGLLALTILATAGRFGQHAIAAAGIGQGTVRQGNPASVFRRRSALQALRRKEWMLLARDPWLVSQSLMQVLYLLPPALLLWRNFGSDTGTLIVLAPVLVMAAGQLAGGLAWLAISGEDAPDLVMTAPIAPSARLRAKIEAVMGAIALPVAPLVLALALASPYIALVTAIGVALAAGSATAVQLFFRTQAKRSHFRRRQTSSRVATFAEAFSSISWAGAAGIAAAGSALAVVPALFAVLVLVFARWLAGRVG